MADTEAPTRILRIISRLNVGGPAVHVVLLTARFRDRGYDARLVAGSLGAHEGDMTGYAREHGVEPVMIAPLGRSLNPWRDLITLRRLYRLMRDFQPQVVHTHTSKAGFLGRVAAWLARVPVIVHTYHGHTFRGYFSPIQSRLFVLLDRLAARLSDTVITPTESLRAELAEVYRVARRRRITVLPLGLDLEPFARTPRRVGDFRAAWHIPPDAPLIGTVGRIIPIKNHGLFLDAAARVRAQIADAQFVIVGDGADRRALEDQAARLGLAGAVTFTGWQQNLPPIYSDLDVSVISSLNEGTPVSVIESLAAGCPVVCTAVGGVPDLLEGGRLGVLVEPGDADALAAALIAAVRSPREDMNMIQRTMLDRYGIDRLVSDLEGLYRGLLARKTRGR
jgi:glycosyltransferase involved in cell wall biosynthesis